jgi:hypothetical protein
VALCRRAWRVVYRLHPSQFDRAVPNPWEGVTKQRRTKGKKAAVTREQVYAFAWGCIERGQPEAAAAAVICFEWLQRPENVFAGYLRWTDYRSKEWPNAVKIEHHKTGAVVWHPLEEQTEAGIVRFYEDAEAVLSRLPRRSVPMILREVKQGITKPFSFSGMQKIVHTMRDKIGLPSTFTLDVCRHGGIDRIGRGGIDRRSGSRAVGTQEPASLRRICEAHDGACIVSNSQALRSQARERGRNEHSE